MKNIKLLFLFVLCVFLITGCMSDVSKKENIIVPDVLPEDAKGWTELSRYIGDVDGDGNDETVVLSTSAERDEDDEILWNDGQDWLLYVSDGDEVYVLLNEFIQLGNIYFEVLDYYMEDGIEPCINIITTTGSGFNLKNYKFDGEGYKVLTLYDTAETTKAGVNRRFTSIPESR